MVFVLVAQLRRQSRNGILVVEWALVNDNRQVGRPTHL